MSEESTQAASWRDILTREYLPKLVTLSMAIWLHAANSMLTATTMPSAVEEVGGLHLISWTFALYLAGSIVSGASASLMVNRRGLRSSMMISALVFSIGCIVVAVAPNMYLILVGRALQGLGGGGLIALAYISQDRFFPNPFIPRIIAFQSIIWMMSAMSGPAIGGAFATAGEWRLAYWTFALQGFLLIPAVLFLLKSSAKAPKLDDSTFPIVRLTLLCSAILLIASSSVILIGCFHLFW